MKSSCALLASLLATLALAAPAPLVRRQSAPVPPLPPECLMRWGGHPWQASFGATGDYEASTASSRYAGTWRLEGQCLVITEMRVGEQGWRIYRVELDAALREGLIDGRASFVLEPMPEPAPSPLEDL